MGSFSKENLSITNGWGERKTAVHIKHQGLRRFKGCNKRLVTGVFLRRRKNSKLEAKGAHFSAQAVHFSHHCLLLYSAHSQRHWCRHYPSSTAVIMLLASAWLKDLICKLSVQHLPTGPCTLRLFYVSPLEQNNVLSWTAANEMQGNIFLLSIQCPGEGVIAIRGCIIQEENTAWRYI